MAYRKESKDRLGAAVRWSGSRALLVLLLPAALAAQVTFERTFGGPENDHGYSVAQLPDSGFALVGDTRSFGAGGADIYVVRTDARGDTLWTRAIGGPIDDYGAAGLPTAAGGCIIAGSSRATNRANIVLTELDVRGDSVWARTYSGSASAVADGMARAADSGLFVAGSDYPRGAGGPNALVIRTDAAGEALWTRICGGPGEDGVYAIAATADSGCVACGATTSFGAGGQDVYIIRLDDRGDTLWTRTWGGAGDDIAYDIAQLADGGFVAVGSTTSMGAGGEFCAVRMDAAGDTLWTRTYGGHGADFGDAVIGTTDGGLILAGTTASFGPGTHDAWLIRTNGAGDTLWTRVFGDSSSNEYFMSVLPVTDGYALAGTTGASGAGGSDLWFVKTDSAGRLGVAEPFEPAASGRIRNRSTVQPAAGAGTSGSVVLFDVSGRRLGRIARAGVYYGVSAGQPVRRVVMVK